MDFHSNMLSLHTQTQKSGILLEKWLAEPGMGTSTPQTIVWTMIATMSASGRYQFQRMLHFDCTLKNLTQCACRTIWRFTTWTQQLEPSQGMPLMLTIANSRCWIHALYICSLERLCGNLTGRTNPITSHILVDTVILRFHTDFTHNWAGFNISYEFIGTQFLYTTIMYVYILLSLMLHFAFSHKYLCIFFAFIYSQKMSISVR